MKYKGEEYEEKTYSKKRKQPMKKKGEDFSKEYVWEEKQKQKINDRRANKKRDKEKYDKYDDWN